MASLFNVSIDFLIGFNYNGQNTTIETNAESTQQLNYNGSDQSKQEISILMQEILNGVSDENQLNQIKMFLETYKK